MSELNLNNMDKQYIQKFFNNAQSLKKHEIDAFKSLFAHGNQAAWHRFLVGAYSHPLTWWIGIVQLQMQMGIWGHQYQSMSRLRANKLWKISEPLRANPPDLLAERNKTILSEIVKYNWNHRKADILGRLVGGKFTNYASMGGRMGNKRLSGTMKFTVTATNFAIASYGSSIKSLVDGNESLEGIIQSVLTGDASHLPDDYKSDGNEAMSSEEKELLENAESTLTGVMSLSQIQSAPVPVAEFCLRPENINLKGLCK